MTQSLPYLDLANPEFSTRSDDVREARENYWCAQTPYGLAVLRYREVGMLLRDRRLRQGSHAWPDKHNLEGSFAGFWKRSVISREGESHRRLRDLCVPVLVRPSAPCSASIEMNGGPSRMMPQTWGWQWGSNANAMKRR